jgi:hypothetical protein
MKINQSLVLFFKSTFTVLVTSILISLSVWMFGGNFIAAFIMSFSIQYILFSFIGTTINNYFSQITRQKELDKLEQLSSLLECAYCKAPNVITFVPDENERVEFVCEKCTKKSVVNINFTVARTTEPIDINLAPPTPNPAGGIAPKI